MSSRKSRLPALKRDLQHAVRLDWRTWRDLLRAIVELAIARLRLQTRNAREFLGSAQAHKGYVSSQTPNRDLDTFLDRVSFAIPRMGRRVPWRADCLVQALAAQHWLSGRGVVTALVIGVRKRTPSDLEAHAWLMAGARIVTGGQVDAYSAILQPMDLKKEVSASRRRRTGASNGPLPH